MFKSNHSVALGPNGEITFPTSARRDMQRQWGGNPSLIAFGVQFLYICHVDAAEDLFMRIHDRLCATFGSHDPQVNDYLHAVERSMAKLEQLPNGRYALPPQTRALLNSPKDGLLTLLGIDDHFELWNRTELETQVRLLQRKGDNDPRALLETNICLHSEQCSLMKDGIAIPKRCGQCLYLRLP